jgi:hypothetical protein
VTTVSDPIVDSIDAMDAATLAQLREKYRAPRSRAGWKYRQLWLRNHAIYLGVIFGFLFVVGNSMSSVAGEGALVMVAMALFVGWLLISRFKLGAYLKKWHDEEAAAKAIYSLHTDTLAHIHERAATIATQPN